MSCARNETTPHLHVVQHSNFNFTNFHHYDTHVAHTHAVTGSIFTQSNLFGCGSSDVFAHTCMHVTERIRIPLERTIDCVYDMVVCLCAPFAWCFISNNFKLTGKLLNCEWQRKPISFEHFVNFHWKQISSTHNQMRKRNQHIGTTTKTTSQISCELNIKSERIHMCDSLWGVDFEWLVWLSICRLKLAAPSQFAGIRFTNAFATIYDFMCDRTHDNFTIGSSASLFWETVSMKTIAYFPNILDRFQTAIYCSWCQVYTMSSCNSLYKWNLCIAWCNQLTNNDTQNSIVNNQTFP